MVEEMTISKTYLKKLDQNLEMIPLTFDVIFKGVFERNLDILKRFLISTLELDLEVNGTKIEILNNELLKENIREYQKRVDILVVLDDRIFIDIEINRSNFEKVKLRNMLYCDKLYSMLLEMGDKTTRLKDICLYQLNLNTKDKSITYGEDMIVAYSLVNQDIFVKNKYMVLKYLEFYRNLYYTNHEKLTESEMWLASLMARNFVELDEMLSYVLGDQDKNRLVSEVIRMNHWNFSLHEWEKEKLDELVRQESERVDREEREAAIKKGIEEGIQEGKELGIQEGKELGIQEGIEQHTKDIIKNMLMNDFDFETISKISGKSVDEIKQMKLELEI